MTVIFWVFILLLLTLAVTEWRKERQVQSGARRMFDEVEAYLLKRRKPDEK